jgi:endonuclease/exonuclease/phosphatase (EEP) superfamily protein YafD
VPHGGSKASHLVGRVIELVAWLVVALVGLITLTQAVGWAGTRLVAVAQSLTPYLGLLLAPIAVVAVLLRRFVLATTCTAIGLGLLLLAAPLAFPDGQPPPAAGATGLRVASVNLLYDNDRVGEVAALLADVAPDVIVFNEYTAEHQRTLLDSPLADRYPYRIDRTGRRASGIAVWSNVPVTGAERSDTYTPSLDVVVDGPDDDIRLVAMHLPTPINSFDNWRRDLHTARQIGRTTTVPTMVIGDLNTSYWHPDFRRVLDEGFVDAHNANGRGFSTSWPTDKFLPAFVRLDHALTIGGLVSTDVDDFEIPGSDHTGFVVSVSPTR